MSDAGFDFAAEAQRFPWIASLNEPQAEAVVTTEGPLLVLAGAGTGKTSALTTRIAHILLTERAQLGQILAVTFTNKAASEMKARVQHLLSRPIDGLWMGTFHSISVRILRRHAELVGLKPNFTILDDDDQERLLKQVMHAHDIDTKRWSVKITANLIGRWKDKALVPEAISHEMRGEFADGKLAVVYKSYQERLLQLNACDFGDLLLHCILLFKQDAAILRLYQDRFRYILVDEYQDTNVAQYIWLRLLAVAHKNICCVGDDDQSIYGWRGAEVGNILKFEQDFQGAKVIRLEQNYRSTPAILGAASAVIAYNQGRLGKTLWTDDKSSELVQVRGLWDGEEEARFVGEEIEAAQHKGQNLADMAVLVRSSSLMRSFEERFVAIGVPYRVVGGPRFYERREIRDALAYLRVLYQLSDDMALERIINVPKRGIGPVALQKLYVSAREMDLPLQLATQNLIDNNQLKGAVGKNLGLLFDDIKRWRALMESTPHPELAEIILDESGYTAMLQNEGSIEAQGRLENLKELVNAMGAFESLGGFLEHVALVMDGLEDQAQDMVTIMTLHSAKGLEFELVFLPGFEQGLFPNQRALDESGSKGLEEERRLAYVGITRARKKLFISHAGRRRLYGQYQDTIPSQFIDELPQECIEVHKTTSNWANSWSGQDSGSFGASQPRVIEPFSPPQSRGQKLGFGQVIATSSDVQRALSQLNTPGWNRARARAQISPKISPKQDSRAQKATKLTFSIGQRGFHQKFGYGSVAKVEHDSLVVSFDNADEMRVKSSFLQLAEQVG